MSFGEVLKEIRNKNGDSLPKLGEKVSVSFSYIDRIEKGKNSISKKIFERILEVYPFDNEKLIEAYCDETLPETIKNKLISSGKENEPDALYEIFLLISKLDKNTKKNIILSLIEKIEYMSFKQGKYEKVKRILEEAKEKTERL